MLYGPPCILYTYIRKYEDSQIAPPPLYMPNRAPGERQTPAVVWYVVWYEVWCVVYTAQPVRLFVFNPKKDK